MVDTNPGRCHDDGLAPVQVLVDRVTTVSSYFCAVRSDMLFSRERFESFPS